MPVKENALLVSVGTLVRKLRGERVLTRRRLASAAGLSERFLAEVEGGEGNISIARLDRLARALGTSAGALLAAAERAGEGAAADERPRVVALLGLRGAGKSTVGRRLAKRLSVPFIELDELVEKDAGLSLAAIFTLHGEAYYRRLAREVLARFLAGHKPAVLATGGSIVADREAFRLLTRRCRTVWLQATPDDHWRRVLEQGDVRPGAASPHAKDELRALLKARQPLYAQAEMAVDTSRLGVEGAVAAIAARVG